MKKIAQLLLTVTILAVPALAAQDFDFSVLDKLGANAKSSTNVTLDADMLKMASNFLDNGDKNAAGIKAMVSGLKGVYVREYQFEKAGQYAEADLAPLREFLKQPKWKAVVDVKDPKESTQVYFLSGANDKLGGMAVVSTEPTALTVVYINGEIDANDLQKLSGNMGIPDLGKLTGGKAEKKTTK